MATDMTRCRGSYGELTVTISLTKKGVESYKAVIMLLFSLLEVLQKEGPKQYFFDELKVMSEALYHTVA